MQRDLVSLKEGETHKLSAFMAHRIVGFIEGGQRFRLNVEGRNSSKYEDDKLSLWIYFRHKINWSNILYMIRS